MFTCSQANRVLAEGERMTSIGVEFNGGSRKLPRQPEAELSVRARTCVFQLTEWCLEWQKGYFDID